MSQKFMSLVFVIVFAGCHSPPQGAVCPSTEEEEVSEPIPEDEAPSGAQQISEVELERARQHSRRSRFLPSR